MRLSFFVREGKIPESGMPHLCDRVDRALIATSALPRCGIFTGLQKRKSRISPAFALIP
jgi:hypothetical protein